VQGVVGAVGFTMIIYVWGSIEALKNLVVAYIIAGAWGLGLNIVAQRVGWDRINHDIKFYVASPVTLPAYFAGIVLGCSPFLASNLIPALAVALIFGIDLTPLLMLLPLAVLALILGAFLSLSIILRIKNPTNISAITNPLYTFTITLPPVYYPLYALPPAFRWAALAVPSASLMEVARWVTGYTAVACSPLWPVLSLAAWTTATSVLVAKRFKWGLE